MRASRTTPTSGMEISPLRPCDDFCAGIECYGKPDSGDLARRSNRVVSNLLYYQTNYLVIGSIVFLVVGFLNPVDMVLGCTVLTLVILGSMWGSENKSAIKNFRKNNPTVFVVALMVASYFLISLFGGHKIFFGIIFPIVLIFLHASLCLQNMKNKLQNRMEGLELKKSPTGVILEASGQLEQTMTKIQDSKLKE